MRRFHVYLILLLTLTLAGVARAQSVITVMAALVVVDFNAAGTPPTVVSRVNVVGGGNPSTGIYTLTLGEPCYDTKGLVIVPPAEGEARGSCGGRFSSTNTITITCKNATTNAASNITSGSRLSVVAWCGK